MNLFLSIGVVLNLSLIIGQLNADQEFDLLTADSINKSHVGIDDASISSPVAEPTENFWMIISDAETYRTDDIQVLAGGEIHRNITKNDLRAFNLTEEIILTAAALHFGEYPEKPLYFNDPTKWGNLFQKFSIESSKFNLRFSHINILNVTHNEKIIKSEKYENLNDKPMKFSSNITYDTENTMSITWPETYGIDVETKMKMNIVIARALTNFNFDYQWGVNVTKTKTITHTAQLVTDVNLQPHEAVTLSIKAEPTVVTAEVVYEADLSGRILANFPNKHDGHYFWFVDLPYILQFNNTQDCGKIGLKVEDCEKMKMSIKRTVQITKTVKIIFYTDASVVVSNS